VGPHSVTLQPSNRVSILRRFERACLAKLESLALRVSAPGLARYPALPESETRAFLGPQSVASKFRSGKPLDYISSARRRRSTVSSVIHTKAVRGAALAMRKAMRFKLPARASRFKFHLARAAVRV